MRTSLIGAANRPAPAGGDEWTETFGEGEEHVDDWIINPTYFVIRDDPSYGWILYGKQYGTSAKSCECPIGARTRPLELLWSSYTTETQNYKANGIHILDEDDNGYLVFDRPASPGQMTVVVRVDEGVETVIGTGGDTVTYDPINNMWLTNRVTLNADGTIDIKKYKADTDITGTTRADFSVTDSTHANFTKIRVQNWSQPAWWDNFVICTPDQLSSAYPPSPR